jgi:dihydroorotate dehydrogenase electron transfer subunit
MRDMSHRGTIKIEQCEITERHVHADGQFVLRMHGPRIARDATPGSFVHLTCAPTMAMRRPLSIMRVSRDEGWFDVLFKDVGAGTKALGERGVGDSVSALGPIGRGFSADRERPINLLIGGGVGIPPMVFLAEHLVEQGSPPALVIMGSEIPFPFTLGTATQSIPGVAHGISATMADLAALDVPTRLTSTQGYSDCYNGYVTGLARDWLAALPDSDLARVTVYACGPNPMLAATAKLAAEFKVPTQVSLEEYMACAVGGCAGCAVAINTPNGPAMKRVCVDGPVFDGSTVDWNTVCH